MLATYRGKLITTVDDNFTLVYKKTQEQVDELIANDSRWPLQNPEYMPITIFRKDDNTPITDADTTSVSNVPSGVDYWINVEIAFVFVPT